MESLEKSGPSCMMASIHGTLHPSNASAGNEDFKKEIEDFIQGRSLY